MPAARPDFSPLQEASDPDSLSKFALSLQSRATLHPAEAPINDIFNAIKDQPWVRRPKLNQHDLTLLRVGEYYSFHESSFHESKGYKTAH